MSADAPILLVLLPACLAAVILGIRLVRRSRSRVGDTPHCRACDYDLTANTSAVCPECGLALDAPGDVVHGDAVRRPGPLAGGLLLIVPASILGGAVALQGIRTYDWYRLRPAGWLIDDVATGRPATARRAMDELMRRTAAGDLSDIAHGRLTGLAITEVRRAHQPVAGNNSIAQDLGNYVGQRILAGALTPSRQDEFFAAALRPGLRIRQLVRAGDPCPVEFSSNWTGPSTNGWWVNATDTSVTVAGATEFTGPGGSSFSGFGSGGNATHYLNARPPGDYPVTVTQTFRAYLGRMSRADSRLVHKWTVSATGLLHVVADEPPGTFTLIDKPDLLPAMRAAVTVARFSLEGNGPKARPLLQVRVAVRNPPENIAFDVTARAAGREFNIGSVRVARGQSTTWYLAADPPRDLNFDKADVHFRPSEKAARSTVDLFRIWNGELLIMDVPLTRPPPTTRPTP